MHKYTIGGYRVGVAFNPSKNALVDRIKAEAANLIDTIDSIVVKSDPSDEAVRLKKIAMTEVETAAMYAVKAATKTDWE